MDVVVHAMPGDTQDLQFLGMFVPGRWALNSAMVFLAIGLCTYQVIFIFNN